MGLRPSELAEWTTVEFSWLAGHLAAYGGDHRTQQQVATLTSMASGFLCKKPVGVKQLMPDYPWPAPVRDLGKRRRLALLAARRG